MYVYVQPWDLGWLNLLVPACRLGNLEELVPVVVPLHVRSGRGIRFAR